MTEQSPAEAIFFAALEKGSAEERSAYLDSACQGDLDLRRRVERLLEAHPKAGGFLEPPVQPAGEATGAFVPSPEHSGYVVAGRYKLLEKIGEGGMGEVWVADQLEPIKRRVALKLIKPGMDSRSVLGRFEAERQALAVMDHPNIAKVLDAGSTSDGRPYFVMELVKGTPITEFCDARKLTPKQRLELFIPVCQAIQHAHMKGIIHRDIKPGNVLVALHDEMPVPKVIDFGVAKAVGQQLTEKTIYTGFGALVGTPAYMAPEQATFNQLDVDTRADVYALGVLLYELLAGSPPIEKERLKLAALDEILRIVRDEEPPRPSQRLSTSQAKASIAATRGSEPAKLTALIKGELDWIVMKALEKDRTRRYESATGLAKDVQRYLANEIVEARPPTFGYRFRKIVRRNKARVASTALVALALATGIAGTTWQAAERRREREVSQLQSLQAASSAADRAEAALVANRLSDVDAALALASERGELAERIESIRSDRDMVGALEDIYEKYWTVCPYHTTRDAEPAKARYPEAFRSYGVVLADVPSAAERVRQSRIASALIDGLGTWFFLDPKVEGLRPLLDRLDPDDFRISVRAAVVAENADRLRELAAKTDASEYPPVFSVMLASAVSDPDSYRILKATWNRHPDSFAVALALSFPSSDEAREKERLAWSRTAVALRPNNALANFYMSLAFNKASDYTGALEALQRVIKLAPRFAHAHAEMGFTLIRLNREDEAFAAFRMATEVDPSNLPGHVGLAQYYAGRKEWVASAAACRSAFKLDEQIGEEGCQNSNAKGRLVVIGAQAAKGLFDLGHFVDLVELWDNLNGSFLNQRYPFGLDHHGPFLDSGGFFPACAAVQAAAGRGANAPPPDRPRVRRLAHKWLSKDLKAGQEKLAGDSVGLREPAHSTMMRWLAEPLLNDVRGNRIAELPKDEQDEWKGLWDEVIKLRDQTAQPAIKK